MSGTILIAEDDASVRARLELMLRESGYRVISAWDGDVTLSECASQRPDLVILGSGISRPNAFEVLARIKEEPSTMWVPVLLSTPAEAEADRLRGLKCGADAFLDSPYDSAEVLSRVRVMLAMTGNPVFDELPPRKEQEEEAKPAAKAQSA